MLPILVFCGALFGNPNSAPVCAAPRNSSGHSFCAAAKWKRIRVVNLVTGTDNGGELQVFGSGSMRKISVSIGLSNAIVDTDFVFERGQLTGAERTRTSFDLGENGIDFNKPVLWQNARYRFKNGRAISRVTREKTANGRWKTGVTFADAISGAQMLEQARFFSKVAASSQKEVDISE